MAVQAHQYSENLGFSLCSSQERMETGAGFYEFYISLQHQQQQQMMMMMMQQNQQINQNLGFDHGQMVTSSNNLFLMAFSQSLAVQVEKQREEIDRLIGSQNERLRSALQQQRKQQLEILLKSLESKTVNLLRQKDEDIAKATKRSMELEDCLRRIEMENQAWQRVAKENEAMVIALNSKLEQVKENVCCFSSGAEDAESCYCDFREEEEKEKTKASARDEEETKKKIACKGCNSRSSCVLFLPCRHLCSCKSCETFLDSCPVCKSVKNASIEVFMF